MTMDAARSLLRTYGCSMVAGVLIVGRQVLLQSHINQTQWMNKYAKTSH